jgi:hypothetical protein
VAQRQCNGNERRDNNATALLMEGTMVMDGATAMMAMDGATAMVMEGTTW